MPHVHPDLTAYRARTGRWYPSVTLRWGNTRALGKGGRAGWASRLWTEADGDLREVSVSFRRDLAATFEKIGPMGRWALTRFTLHTLGLLPKLGCVRLEFSPLAGWNLEGVVSAADAERMTSPEARALRGDLADVNVRPISDLAMYERALKYQSKGYRKYRDGMIVPSWERRAHADTVLRADRLAGLAGLKRAPTLYFREGIPDWREGRGERRHPRGVVTDPVAALHLAIGEFERGLIALTAHVESHARLTRWARIIRRRRAGKAQEAPRRLPPTDSRLRLPEAAHGAAVHSGGAPRDGPG